MTHLKDNDIDKYDFENLNNKYKSGDLAKYLGISRDTVRHYEEMGLIKPEIDDNNQYRNFTFYDIYHLMGIDFYKKRGFSLNEIKETTEDGSISKIDEVLKKNKVKALEQIRLLERQVEYIEKSREFIKNLDENLNTFSIKPLPLYEIRSKFSAGSALHEYRDNVLPYLNSDEEDILTNMVRRMTFDENGYKYSEMCIVQKSDKKEDSKDYLLQGNCIYTIVEDTKDDGTKDTLNLSTLEKGLEFAESIGVGYIGEVYLFGRLNIFNDNDETMYVEAWAPIKTI